MLVAGVLAALGFPPVANIFPLLASVAIMMLVFGKRAESGSLLRWDAALGMIFGLGFFGTLLWWLNVIGTEAYVVVVLAESLFISAGFLCLRLVHNLRFWPLWASTIWVAFEFLRSSVPFGGFPWGRFAYATVGTPLESISRVAGVPIASGLVFLAGSLIAVIISHGKRSLWLPASTIATIFLVSVLLPTGVANGGVTKEVALVQGNVPALFEPWPRGQILDLHIAEITRLASDIQSGRSSQPDLVLWPENSTDTDVLADPSARARIQQAVADVGAPILVGAILDGPNSSTAYNAGIAWTNSGPGTMYFKQKLVPFGEYVPFREHLTVLSSRLEREVARDMIPGDTSGVLDVGGMVLGDMICWDVAHDRILRETIEAGAEVLVVQTSNASFTGTAQPAQQWQISRLRAIQSGRWVLIPSTNGITGVINAAGETVVRAPTQTAAHVSAEIELGRGQTWGVRLGDRSSIPIAIIALFVTAIGTVRHLRRSDSRTPMGSE